MKHEDFEKREPVADMLVLSSQCLRCWNNRLVFVSLYTNKVFIIRLEDYQIENIVTIPFVASKNYLFRDFIIYEENLILIPFNAPNFVKINLRTLEVIELDGILKDTKKNVAQKFLLGIQGTDHLWCVGESISKIICMDFDQLCTWQIDYPKKGSDQLLWSDAYIIIKDTILIPSRNCDAVLEINDVNRSVKLHVLEGAKQADGFLGIAWIENQIHLFDSAGLEYIWDPKDESVEQLDGKERTEHTFVSRQCFMYKNKFFRVGLYDNEIFMRDDKNSLQQIAFPKGKLWLDKRIAHFNNGCTIGQYFYIQSRYGYLFKVNMETLDITEIVIYDKNQANEGKRTTLQEFITTLGAKEGEEAGNLQDYICHIKTWAEDKKCDDVSEVGQDIYDITIEK